MAAVRWWRDILLVSLGTFGGVFLTAITPGSNAAQMAGGGVVGCAALLGVVAILERKQGRLKHEPGAPDKTHTQVVVPARLVKTELQSVLARVHRLMKLDPALTEDYLLSSEQRAAYRERLAELESYEQIVTAYQEIARVNDQWRWRREGAGANRIAVNREKDGLERLEAAAKNAIDVLDQDLTRSRPAGGPR